MAFVALGVAKRTKFDIGDFSERAGSGKPLVANYFVSESMSTMTGNGIATGVGGSSGISISSMPITGKAVGWDWRGILVELSIALLLVTVTVLLAVYRIDRWQYFG